MPDMNEGKPWTEQDDFDLRIEVSTGSTVEHAATFLCRPVEEVLKRAAQLRLRWHGSGH
jgi:hypothetical protein